MTCYAVLCAAGARDLIPRMLLVDPLKRITIPEVSSSSSSSRGCTALILCFRSLLC
jgi:hypothetical protein